MKKWFTTNMVFFLILFLVFYLHACSDAPHKQHKKHPHKAKKESTKPEAVAMPAAATAACDASIWARVYDPDRLRVLDSCKTVTGTITERNADPDGDEHMLLKVDPGQEALLLKKNRTKKAGGLVVEVVCVNNITRKRAKGVCDGYVNNVQLPAVGDHVRVTGSYVIDSHNGWAEIHPATKIEKLN